MNTIETTEERTKRNACPDRKAQDTAQALPAEPLAITITAASQENLALRLLARQAIPMLRRPQRFAEADRLRLAQAIEGALDRDYDGELPGLPPDPDPYACGGAYGPCDCEAGGWDEDDEGDPFAESETDADNAGEEG